MARADFDGAGGSGGGEKVEKPNFISIVVSIIFAVITILLCKHFSG